MLRTVRHRRFGAALLAALLLFTQVLAAAYACPRQTQPDASWVAAAVDCGGHAPVVMDPDQPLLCKAHCELGEPSTHTCAPIDLHADAATMPLLLWILPEPQAQADPSLTDTASGDGPPRGAPPLYLSLLVLRN